MLVHVCRTGQFDIRNMSIQRWGANTATGRRLLYKLVQLYTALVWESTLLLALCTDDIIPEGCDFGKEDMDRLPNDKATTTAAASANAVNAASDVMTASAAGTSSTAATPTTTSSGGAMHSSSTMHGVDGTGTGTGGVGSLLTDSDMRE